MVALTGVMRDFAYIIFSLKLEIEEELDFALENLLIGGERDLVSVLAFTVLLKVSIGLSVCNNEESLLRSDLSSLLWCFSCLSTAARKSFIFYLLSYLKRLMLVFTRSRRISNYFPKLSLDPSLFCMRASLG